jgi:hypothetical protein
MSVTSRKGLVSREMKSCLNPLEALGFNCSFSPKTHKPLLLAKENIYRNTKILHPIQR